MIFKIVKMNYDETIVANNINGNNINITTGNDFNSVNTIINNNIIDSKETIDNLNNQPLTPAPLNPTSSVSHFADQLVTDCKQACIGLASCFSLKGEGERGYAIYLYT